VATQLTLSFDPPKFDTLKEVINHVVYASGRQLKYIAAELGMSPSQLSMILAGADGRNFPAEKIPDLIRATAPKGHLIIHWLIEQFLAPKEDRQAAALAAVEQMLPDLQQALAELKGRGPKR
jgi:hypothetical protein